jgi:hypothetical protein
MQNIKGNHELIASIVYFANKLNCLHQLACLAQDCLNNANIFSATLQDRFSVVLPNFMDSGNSADHIVGECALLHTIKHAVLGQGNLQSNGWVRLWKEVKDDAAACHKHVDALINFFVLQADKKSDQFFEDIKSKARTSIISTIVVPILSDKNLEQMEALLLKCCFIALLRKSLWLNDVYAIPAIFTNYCCMCRERERAKEAQLAVAWVAMGGSEDISLAKLWEHYCLSNNHSNNEYSDEEYNNNGK